MKSLSISLAWNRFLFGFHYINPNGNLFWSVWIGFWKVSYDFKPTILKDS